MRFTMNDSYDEICHKADEMTPGKEYIPQVAEVFIAAKAAIEQNKAAESMKTATWALCVATFVLGLIAIVQMIMK